MKVLTAIACFFASRQLRGYDIPFYVDDYFVEGNTNQAADIARHRNIDDDNIVYKRTPDGIAYDPIKLFDDNFGIYDTPTRNLRGIAP